MIVLTGGAGFIGSNMLKKLNDEGIDDVLVLDNIASTDKWKNLLGKKFFLYMNKKEDLEDEYEFEELDAVIHLGACTSTVETNSEYLLENNFAFSRNLAITASLFDVPFIYASSAATYGMGEFGYNDNLLHELRPLNPYGYSKLLFDIWFTSYLKSFQSKAIGLRFFNVYGPNEYHKADMASMVYKSYKQISETGKIKLFKSNEPSYKDGEQKRDFIYVKDVVDIIWRIYKKGYVMNGIYNLGTGKARSWNELANAVFDSMGKKPIIEYIDMPDNIKNQYQNFTEADMTRFSELNIDIKFTSLEDGVNDYVRNYLQKQNPYC